MFLALTESDGLALAMLATLLVSFGVIVMLLGCMLRNASRRNKEVDDLLEELERDEKVETKAGKAKPMEKREEWERDGDWWRDQF